MNKIRLRGHLYLISIITVLILGTVYLNLAYAHIYNMIQVARLKPVNELVVYNFNENNNDPAGTIPSIKYVALGDSLTFGVGTQYYSESYPFLVSKKLYENNGEPLTLYNFSWPGDKSSDLIAKFLDYTINEKPNKITILIGINDIHSQISASKFQNNYAKILSRLTNETKADIYVISIPYLGSGQILLPPYNYYFNYKTRQFNEIIKELAAEYEVNYIDLYSPTVNLFKKSGDHYSSDFYHPSAGGYALWGQIIYDNINK